MSNNQIQTPETIPTAGARQVASREVRQEAVRRLFGAASPQPELSGTGFVYRQDWGLRRGEWILQLNSADINPRSQVFVSIGEGAPGGPDAGKFIGAARYTVHNVAPRAGGVDVWVNIEWEADIPLYADYLVVNPGGVGARTVQVTVQRHSTVALTEAEADRILSDMGTVLQSDDSPEDIATPVQFVRNGAVQVLPATVPGAIQTEADWIALINAGTGVKIVDAIRWCGGPGDRIIGCAPIGSPTVNLAVVRYIENMEGVLWAHEYGHNAGLGHRMDNMRAVMYPIIDADHNVVNAAESEVFRNGPVTVAASGAVMPASCSMGVAIPPPKDVREFVSQRWIHGIPYQAASQYTEEDAKLLLEWLVNEPEMHEEFLPQIVTTLGFIGSEVAVEPLIDFVQSVRASRSVFNAKNAALIHLGDLVNKSGSQAALQFLTKVASDTGTATTMAVARASVAAAEASVAGVDAPSLEVLAAELAVSATFGLALAATAEAEQTLARLKDAQDAFASVKRAASEAVELARTVRAQGQKEYYRMKCEGGQQP